MTEYNVNFFNSLYPGGRPILDYAKPNYSKTLDFKEAAYPSRDPAGFQPSLTTETRTILQQASSTLPDQRAITINSERRLYDKNIKLRYPDLMFKKSSTPIAPPTAEIAKTNTELLTELNTYPDGVRKVSNVNPGDRRAQIIREYEKLLQAAEHVRNDPVNYRRRIEYAKDYLLKHDADLYAALQARQHQHINVGHQQQVQQHQQQVQQHHQQVEEKHDRDERRARAMDQQSQSTVSIGDLFSELSEALSSRSSEGLAESIEGEQSERRKELSESDKGSALKQELAQRVPKIEGEKDVDLSKDITPLKAKNKKELDKFFLPMEPDELYATLVDIPDDKVITRLFDTKRRREKYFEKLMDGFLKDMSPEELEAYKDKNLLVLRDAENIKSVKDVKMIVRQIGKGVDIDLSAGQQKLGFATQKTKDEEKSSTKSDMEGQNAKDIRATLDSLPDKNLVVDLVSMKDELVKKAFSQRKWVKQLIGRVLDFELQDIDSDEADAFKTNVLNKIERDYKNDIKIERSSHFENVLKEVRKFKNSKTQ